MNVPLRIGFFIYRPHCVCLCVRLIVDSVGVARASAIIVCSIHLLYQEKRHIIVNE